MNAAPSHTAGCDYCGLPVPAGWLGDDTSDAPAYCCYGCRFAAAVAQERGEAGRLRWNLTRLGLGIFFSMNVMVFTLVLWSLDVFPDSPQAEATQATLLWDLFRYLCLLFSLPVLFLLGGPLLENALAGLRRGAIGTDLLLLAGVAAAYVYSAVSVFRGAGHVYLEVGCMILVAVTLGRWLEATGKWKATDALKSLTKLLPDEVRVVEQSRTISRPLSDIESGDQLRVLAGERLPVDGVVVAGEASVDEQLVTGESRPLEKQPGDAVFGGTLNLDGTLVVEATADAGHGALERLITAVVEAAHRQDRWRRLADRVSAWFTPAVALIAMGAFVGHCLTADFQHGLLAGLAVLLIACPCALGIATPLATWAAMGNASRLGLLFRDGDALARLADARVICFDKTGTLTDGVLQVEQLVLEDPADREQALHLACALGESSTHLISQAIVRFAAAQCANGKFDSRQITTSVETVAGQGLLTRQSNLVGSVALGNERLMDREGMVLGRHVQQAVDESKVDEQSVCYIGWEGRVRGVFLLDEHLRPEAPTAIAQLRQDGVQVHVLTGDRLARGQRLAEQLDVAVQAELLPEEKLAALEQLRRQHGHVAMVGDGLNDAPALASAYVGLALGCGADVSREAADVCLLRDDLSAVPRALELAHATARTIRQNLVWAFSYNTIGILLAVCGWLNPILAAMAMAISSLLVVSNSLKLAAAPAGGDALRSQDSAPEIIIADEERGAQDDRNFIEQEVAV